MAGWKMKCMICEIPRFSSIDLVEIQQHAIAEHDIDPLEFRDHQQRVEVVRGDHYRYELERLNGPWMEAVRIGSDSFEQNF